MPDTTARSLPATLKSWKSHSGRWLQGAVALGLIAGLVLIAQAWLLASVINAVVFEKATLAQVMPSLWGLLALFVLRAGLSWAAEQAGFHAAVQVKLALREQRDAQLHKLGPAWLHGERTGDVVNTVVDGIEALEPYYARFLPTIAIVALVPLAILVFVFANDWLSGLIMLVTAPLIPLFMVFIGKGAEKRNQKQWRILAWMSAHFLDTLQGLTTLKLFNASRREAQMIAQVSEQYRKQTMSVLRIAFLSSFALEFFATVSIAMVAVLVGFRLYWGEMHFLQGFFVLLLAPEFYQPLRNLGTHYHARMAAIGAAERLVEILDTPSAALAGTRTSVPDLHEATVQFKAVGFSYPDGRKGVEELNLTIYPGETLAIVGPSGAGKTTLINLLMGFIQAQRGTLLIDNIPLSDIDPDSWHHQLAWLPQRPTLFPASVSDNIRMGAVDAGPEAIRHAARLAQADHFISALPQAYDTFIGETGHGLSGGQIQRIALARAFLKQAPLVILDEASANLDSETEALVQTSVEQLAAGCTLIMIAHRLHSIRRADRIVVMDKGRIIQTGTHTDLLQTCAVYQSMVGATETDDA
ncbi:MAG: thiol reductant ABC exporter subunit CydD [Gammaproteobacteria bacterium]